MVSISRQRLQRQRHDREVSERLAAYVLAAIGSVFFAYVAVLTMMGGGGDAPASFSTTKTSSESTSSSSSFRKSNHIDLHVPNDPNAESYNAIAADILQTLDCVRLLNETTTNTLNYNPPQRRLQEHEPTDDLFVDKHAPEEHIQEINPIKSQNEMDGGRSYDMAMDDGLLGGSGGAEEFYNYDVTPTAAHLFCLAAMAGSHVSADDPYEIPTYWNQAIHCPVMAAASERHMPANNDDSNQLQLQLLQLWSQARADMSPNQLLTTLQLASEHTRVLLGKSLFLWAPAADDGLEYMMNVLNDPDKSADHGGIRGLEHNLGAGKLFVDVGACLGLTSMAIQILYPGTQIVSIEAASPNWLLQQLNWKCNARELLGSDRSSSSSNLVADNHQQNKSKEPTLLLAGVGPEMGGMVKLLWRPQATTSTRSWTPAAERADSAMELLVKLRPWHKLLAEAEIQHMSIDVLNVDCEGCEYNLIPALTQDEYDSISTVLGGVHWGYMPESKLPSSKRGALTHERLCKHENFARTVKECCAFPDLAVISSVPGEVLVQDSEHWPPKPSTVRDVAGTLCDDFDKWAEEHRLNDIESDFGWFQITSMAD